MIVDVHTRIWESTQQFAGLAAGQLRGRHDTPWQRPDGSISSHQQAMKPVNSAIILGFECHTLNVRISAEAVARYVAQAPGKYLGFVGIDPSVGSVRAKLDRAQELGLGGVTISPAAQGFHPADTRAMKLYEQCQQRGLPIIFESGSLLARQAKMEFDQPHLLDEIARTFVDLKIVLTALGDPWVDQGLALVAKHPTVFADLSDVIARPWQLYNVLLRAFQRGVIDQLVLGSNFPLMTPEQAIVTIYSVNTLIQGTHLPSVPREQLRSIVERDALACLGLDPPTGPTGEEGRSDDAIDSVNEPAWPSEPGVTKDAAGDA